MVVQKIFNEFREIIFSTINNVQYIDTSTCNSVTVAYNNGSLFDYIRVNETQDVSPYNEKVTIEGKELELFNGKVRLEFFSTLPIAPISIVVIIKRYV